MDVTFRRVADLDLPALAEILNYYIVNTTVTFHKELLTAADMRDKVYFDRPWYSAFVVEQCGTVIGYCAVSPWKKQEAYRHTAEVNIYLRHNAAGKGVGPQAVRFLEEFARSNDIHVLIAGLCSENEPSKRLFEKCGYEHCAHFRNVGRKFGRVLSTIYYQKELA